MMKSPTKSKTCQVALLLMAGTALVGNAASVSIDNVVSWDHNTPNGTLNASGSDALLVIVTGEHHFGNTNGAVNGVTYDGAAMTQVLDLNPINSSNIQAISYYYLQGPTTSTGLIQVSKSGNNFVYTALSLTGATGIGSSASIRDGSTSVSFASDPNSLIIGAISMGGDHTGGGSTGNTALINEPVVSGGFTDEEASLEIGSNWAGHVVGSGDGGAGTYGFTNPNNRPGISITAIEITGAAAVIPEPSSVALLGLGGIALLLRRRK